MRFKIIAGNLTAVVVLGLASYWLVQSEFEQRLVDDIEAGIGQEQLQLEHSWRLSGMEFMSAVRDRADTSQLKSVFAALDETGRRNRAYEAAEAVARWFQDPARGMPSSPEIVVITDETGHVMARNADRNQMYGTPLEQQIPVLKDVLRSGTARIDIWNHTPTGDLLRTAVAPISTFREGRLLGALVVSYDVSDGVALSEAKMIGRDVAFVSEGRVYSSSLPPQALAELKTFLFSGRAKAQTYAALHDKAHASNTWVTSLGDHVYQGVITPLPLTNAAPLAAVVLADRDEVLSKASPVNIILILTVFIALVVIGYGIVIGSMLLRPIEQIEEGVLGVINGNTEMRLDIKSAELGGLAYRINQLLNVFAGVPDGTSPLTEDHSGISQPPEPSAWRDAAFKDSHAGRLRTQRSRSGTGRSKRSSRDCQVSR